MLTMNLEFVPLIRPIAFALIWLLEFSFVAVINEVTLTETKLVANSCLFGRAGT